MREIDDVRPRDEHDMEWIRNVHPPDWVNPRPARRYNPVVVWRRYFVKGEVLPFELTYRLGE